MTTAADYKWGIDLGGNKIEGIILKKDGDRVSVILRKRIATEAAKGYDHILSRIQHLISEMSTETDIECDALGIGTPGRIDRRTSQLKNSNTTCLNGRGFLDDLKQILNIPIRIENDANCFALSEAMQYEAKHGEAELVFGVIMGSGVGGGIVAHGKVISGLHGIGGEWGHNYMDASGGECYCGKAGCTERILSGPALEKFYFKLSGQQKKLVDIVSLARSKSDAAAVATLDRLIEFFGKGMASIINVLDPEVLIIGGGVGNIDELYTDGVSAILPHLFNDYLDTKIVRPVLGDSSGVFGAALL